MATRTLLVVDDDPDVREIVALSLRTAGHVVLEAANAGEAIPLLRQHAEIELIFTDIVMPGTDGFRFADMAKAQRPDVRVLYTTGFADRVEAYHGAVHGPILAKPYRMGELLAAIDRVLTD
ncbi:MAG: response regulator [Proteobacteria bacterium]|nr:response regulator [Pseudomonadota bacterium]